MNEPAAQQPAGERSELVRWAGLVLVCAAAALAALIELLLVPLYVGSQLVPVAAVFGVVSNVAFPRLARVFLDRPAAMLAPFACWLLPTVLLALTPRPEGDVLVPGGSGVQWVFYALLFGGILAGIVTIVASPTRRAPTAFGTWR